MRSFGDIDLSEGTEIGNMTVSRGEVFPDLPNSGELFYLLVDLPGFPEGLYHYEANGLGWEPIQTGVSHSAVVQLAGSVIQGIDHHNVETVYWTQLLLDQGGGFISPRQVVDPQNATDADLQATGDIEFLRSGIFKVDYGITIEHLVGLRFQVKAFAEVENSSSSSNILQESVSYDGAKFIHSQRKTLSRSFILQANVGDVLRFKVAGENSHSHGLVHGALSGLIIEQIGEL